MNILDWFDTDNIEHIQAYEHLQDTGLWPEGFVPEDIKFKWSWQIMLTARLADRYIEEKLSRELYYEDYSYYVGGEITCGRMPLKYGSWIVAGRPA